MQGYDPIIEEEQKNFDYLTNPGGKHKPEEEEE